MKWISGLVFFASIVSFSQETKFVLRKRTGFVEEYYVLSTDNKIRSGTYVKYKNGFSGISVLESGMYKNGKKDGPWEFYYDVPNSIFFIRKNKSNSLKEKGHFINDKRNGIWATFYLDTISNNVTSQKFGSDKKVDSLNISILQNDLRPMLVGEFLNDEKVGEWISLDFAGNIHQRYNFTNSRLLFDKSISDSLKYNYDRLPLYIGGLPCLNHQLAYGYKGVEVSIKKDSSTVIVEFLINTSGKIGDIKIVQSNGSLPMKKEALRLVTLLDSKWIPALHKGQLIASSYKIGFDIIRKTKSERVIEFRISYRVIK